MNQSEISSLLFQPIRCECLPEHCLVDREGETNVDNSTAPPRHILPPLLNIDQSEISNIQNGPIRDQYYIN